MLFSQLKETESERASSTQRTQMTTLLVDNYDSFTFNLYQYLSELGAKVHVVRNDVVSVQDCLNFNPINVVISPGNSIFCSPSIMIANIIILVSHPFNFNK